MSEDQVEADVAVEAVPPPPTTISFVVHGEIVEKYQKEINHLNLIVRRKNRKINRLMTTLRSLDGGSYFFTFLWKLKKWWHSKRV